jgi:fibronectin type 3 domain-containing protein
MIYIDSVFVANTTHNFYNHTGLNHGTTYDIGIRTVDDSGNINSTWVNDSATTTSPTDTTPPASVTNLRENGTGTQWIKWEWTDPDDADFSQRDGLPQLSILSQIHLKVLYNATGLTEGTYILP